MKQNTFHSEVGLTYRRDANEAEHCVFLGAGEGNMPSSYLSDDDSSLAVDAEGQMVWTKH